MKMNEAINKKKKKRISQARLVTHNKIKLMNKQIKKKAKLPLVTLLKNVKQKNTLLAQELAKQLELNKEMRGEMIIIEKKNMYLQLAFKRRFEVFSKIVKESISRLVPVVNSAESILAFCDEFTSSNDISLMDLNTSTAKRKSSKSSTKGSPSCVVLPTVSGHTITKPTINLSRLNMERLANIQNLSTIEEATPPRNESSINVTSRSSNATRNSITNQQGRYVHNLPERLNTSNISTDDEDRNRPNESVRLSERRSRRISRNSRPSIIERFSSNKTIVSSPKIKLKKVSINLRKLDASITKENTSSRNSSHESNQSSDSDTIVNNSFPSETELKKTPNTSVESPDYSNYSKSKTSNNLTNSFAEDDPLEGPSWKYSNSMSTSNNNNDDLEITKGKSNSNVYNNRSVDNHEDDYDNDEETERVNNFVAFQRGSCDVDEFTWYLKKKSNDEGYDLNDYSLPVLDTPLMDPAALVNNDPDDITCTVPNFRANTSTFRWKNPCDTSTLRLSEIRQPPILDINTPMIRNRRKSIISQEINKIDYASDKNETAETIVTKSQKRQKKSEKDPSSATVVVTKLKNHENFIRESSSINTLNNTTLDSTLNSTYFGSRSNKSNKRRVVESDSDLESEDETIRNKTRNSKASNTKGKQNKKTSMKSVKEEKVQSSDSECSKDSLQTSGRPKRNVAPRCLKEPKINTKMRRQ